MFFGTVAGYTEILSAIFFGGGIGGGGGVDWGISVDSLFVFRSIWNFFCILTCINIVWSYFHVSYPSVIFYPPHSWFSPGVFWGGGGEGHFSGVLVCLDLNFTVPLKSISSESFRQKISQVRVSSLPHFLNKAPELQFNHPVYSKRNLTRTPVLTIFLGNVKRVCQVFPWKSRYFKSYDLRLFFPLTARLSLELFTFTLFSFDLWSKLLQV